MPPGYPSCNSLQSFLNANDITGGLAFSVNITYTGKFMASFGYIYHPHRLDFHKMRECVIFPLKNETQINLAVVPVAAVAYD